MTFRSAYQNFPLLNFVFFFEPRREFTIHPRAKPNTVAMTIQSTIWLAT